MIFTRFHDITIKNKLTAIIMLTSATALLMGLSAFITWEYFDIKKKMVANLSTHAAIIADNTKAAVVYENADDAREMLSALRAAPSIIHARICTEDSNTLAIFNKDPNDTSTHVLQFKDEGYYFTHNSLNLQKNIVLNNEKIGTIYLKSNLNEIKQGATRTATIGAIIAAIITFVTFLVSSKLQKIISGPILSLAMVAKDVSENKDYSTRALKHSKDEVGQLIDAFNEMLYEIQERDLELTNLNEKLELRVKERTADLVNANTKLAKLNKELEETVVKLTAANIELADFAHIAAHDLKAPLRAIGSLAGMIVEDYTDRLDEQGQKQLNLLIQRTERMSELINGILRYSEIGRLSNEKRQVDINQIIEEVISNIAPPENIEIKVENKLPSINSDKTSLIQLFQNLLSNAIKYMDKPQGLIKVGCIEEDDFWKFYVSDNGPGIDKKYHEKIYTIFQTLKRRDEVESTGIGLAMVKKIITLYNGKTWVESEVGHGSTFFFTLPKEKREVKKHEKLQTNIVG